MAGERFFGPVGGQSAASPRRGGPGSGGGTQGAEDVVENYQVRVVVAGTGEAGTEVQLIQGIMGVNLANGTGCAGFHRNILLLVWILVHPD